jgi:hypothetical protein
MDSEYSSDADVALEDLDHDEGSASDESDKAHDVRVQCSMDEEESSADEESGTPNIRVSEPFHATSISDVKTLVYSLNSPLCYEKTSSIMERSHAPSPMMPPCLSSLLETSEPLDYLSAPVMQSSSRLDARKRPSGKESARSWIVKSVTRGRWTPPRSCFVIQHGSHG